MANAHPASRSHDRVVVRCSGKVLFLEVEELDFIEASGNYIRIHAGGEQYLVHESLGRVENALDKSIFARVHRSVIINLHKIRSLQPCNSGEYIMTLASGKSLPVSKRYREAISAYLASAVRLGRHNGAGRAGAGLAGHTV